MRYFLYYFYEKFVGYDVGNNMIYVKSYLSHMFPSNGALIKTERHLLKTCMYNKSFWDFILWLNINYQIKASKTFITTSVVKDGNTYSVHLVDPESKKKVNEEAPTEEGKRNLLFDFSSTNLFFFVYIKLNHKLKNSKKHKKSKTTKINTLVSQLHLKMV